MTGTTTTIKKVIHALTVAAVLLTAATLTGASAASKSHDDHGAAADSRHGGGGDHGAEDNKPGPTVVVVPIIVLPMTNETGELLRYGYILIHLEIPNPLDRWDVEDKIPYIKDAFIRELHAGPTTIPGTEDLNVEEVRARLAEKVHGIVGDHVGEVIFKEIAFPPN